MEPKWRNPGMIAVSWLIKDTTHPETAEPTFHVRLDFTAPDGRAHSNACRVRREFASDADAIEHAKAVLLEWAEEVIAGP